MSPITASEAELATARLVIRTARTLLTDSADGDEVAPEPFLYARVDLVSDEQDNPVLMELEMVEPSLFTSLGSGALDRFAEAIVARAR